MKVESPTKVATGKTKQDTVITDATGTLRLTLWEEDVGRLDEGKSYKLVNMLVRCYKGCNYLSFPTNGSAEETTDVDTGSINIECSIPQEALKCTVSTFDLQAMQDTYEASFETPITPLVHAQSVP